MAKRRGAIEVPLTLEESQAREQARKLVADISRQKVKVGVQVEAKEAEAKATEGIFRKLQSLQGKANLQGARGMLAEWGIDPNFVIAPTRDRARMARIGRAGITRGTTTYDVAAESLRASLEADKIERDKKAQREETERNLSIRSLASATASGERGRIVRSLVGQLMYRAMTPEVMGIAAIGAGVVGANLAASGELAYATTYRRERRGQMFAGADRMTGENVARQLAGIESQRAGIGRIIEWIPIAGQIFTNAMNKAAEAATALGEAHRKAASDSRELSIGFARVRGDTPMAFALEQRLALDKARAEVRSLAAGMGYSDAEISKLPTSKRQLQERIGYADKMIGDIQARMEFLKNAHIVGSGEMTGEYKAEQARLDKWMRRRQILGMQYNIYGGGGLTEEQRIARGVFEAQYGPGGSERFGIAAGRQEAMLRGQAAQAGFNYDARGAFIAQQAIGGIELTARHRKELAGMPETDPRYAMIQARQAQEQITFKAVTALAAREFANNPGQALMTSTREAQGPFGGPMQALDILQAILDEIRNAKRDATSESTLKASS